MSERELANAFQAYFGLSQEHEDALWARFATRRQESAAWAAFGSAMVLMTVHLRPAQRVPMQLFQSMFGRQGR